MRTTTIGILGDFSLENPVHKLTDAAFDHVAKAIGKAITIQWLPTDEVHRFEQYHGLLCAPGRPYRSFAGALAGIRYARETAFHFLAPAEGSSIW